MSHLPPAGHMVNSGAHHPTHAPDMLYQPPSQPAPSNGQQTYFPPYFPSGPTIQPQPAHYQPFQPPPAAPLNHSSNAPATYPPPGNKVAQPGYWQPPPPGPPGPDLGHRPLQYDQQHHTAGLIPSPTPPLTTLPPPYHGQGQYSHEVNNLPSTYTPTPASGDLLPVPHTSNKPSPVSTPQIDAVEGQFAPGPPVLRPTPQWAPQPDQQRSAPFPHPPSSSQQQYRLPPGPVTGPPPAHAAPFVPAGLPPLPSGPGPSTAAMPPSGSSSRMAPSRELIGSGPFASSLDDSMSQMHLPGRPVNLLQERVLFAVGKDGKPELPPRPQLQTQTNCDPDVMRCTLNAFPSTSKLLSKCRLPLGLLLQPFRQLPSMPIIQPAIIVRCRSCRTYISPFVTFLDSGRRWRCNVCIRTNDLPDDFFYDPISKVYGDPSRRPELRYATVEYIAPSEYMLRPPQPASYLFCLEVSRQALATGYLHLVCAKLTDLIDRIPGDGRTQIAFLTYDSGVHFYKLSGEMPRMMICKDLDEVFLPDADGLLVNLKDSKETVLELLKSLPSTFAGTQETGNCLGSALQGCMKLIGGCGGRVTVFNTSLPNMDPGALKPREDANERAGQDVRHLTPAIDFYKTFALECSGQQVSVDLFLLNSQYCDLATLAGVARHSSGSVYHYPDFYHEPGTATFPDAAHQHSKSQVADTVQRFLLDFAHYLTRPIGFEAVMRVRCSRGIVIQAFHGCFFVRSTDLLSLPTVNPDAGFAIQLALDDSLTDLSTVCCQAAVLYTSSQGDRRIRVHTLCLPVTSQAEELFASADHHAIVALLAKMAVDRSISSTLANARDAMINAVVDSLSAYAAAVLPQHSRSSTLACPYNLRQFALYVWALLRCRAFRVGISTRLDDRVAAMEQLKSLPVGNLLTLIYPRLYAVHRLLESVTLAELADQKNDKDGEASEEDQLKLAESVPLPVQTHLSAQNIDRVGLYLLDTGEGLLLLVCSAVQPKVMRAAFGVDSLTELGEVGGNCTTLPPRTSRRLRGLITSLQRERGGMACNLVLVPPDHPLRSRLVGSLVEDRTEAASSYYEFLQMVHKAVK